MKLKNKKTGEVKDVESLGQEKSLKDKYGPQITLSWDTKYEHLVECRTYNSLAELNAEWEDVPEEPKVYWYMSNRGDIRCTTDEDTDWDNDRKQIGNYFESKEETERAREKLKTWKRLKDKGFRFKGISRDYDTIYFDVDIENLAGPVIKDLDLLFGGEE